MQLLEQYPVRQTSRTIEFLVQATLLLDSPYQRGSVWEPFRRVNLIRSLLMGLPVGTLVLNDRTAARWDEQSVGYVVVDGKQRIETLVGFVTDQFRVPGCWFGRSGEVRFSELPLSVRQQLVGSEVSVLNCRLPTYAAELEVYQLINYGGVPHETVPDRPASRIQAYGYEIPEAHYRDSRISANSCPTCRTRGRWRSGPYFEHQMRCAAGHPAECWCPDDIDQVRRLQAAQAVGQGGDGI